MIPSALAGQLQQGLADFLRFSFWSSTPGMEHVIDDLLAEPGGLLKGPYVSIKLPFMAGTNPRYFPDVPLGFTPHLHQEQAFERLGGRRKLSTLIATVTGSGKTESFLVPILDHCLSDAGGPGVKAILHRSAQLDRADARRSRRFAWPGGIEAGGGIERKNQK